MVIFETFWHGCSAYITSEPQYGETAFCSSFSLERENTEIPEPSIIIITTTTITTNHARVS
jgi:hypothetical protein